MKWYRILEISTSLIVEVACHLIKWLKWCHVMSKRVLLSPQAGEELVHVGPRAQALYYLHRWDRFSLRIQEREWKWSSSQNQNRVSGSDARWEYVMTRLLQGCQILLLKSLLPILIKHTTKKQNEWVNGLFVWNSLNQQWWCQIIMLSKSLSFFVSRMCVFQIELYLNVLIKQIYCMYYTFLSIHIILHGEIIFLIFF